MPKKQPPATIDDVLVAVNKFATDTEQRFQKIEGVTTQLQKDVTQIKASMVTKDYLDIKLADLKGDIISTLRKEDIKLATLVDKLTEKKVLSQADAKQILTLEPFPQLMLWFFYL